MVKSVSCCCVRGSRLFSDLVTYIYIYICVCVCVYIRVYIHTVICISTLMVHWHPMLVADQLTLYTYVYVTYTMIIILALNLHFYNWSKLGSL